MPRKISQLSLQRKPELFKAVLLLMGAEGKGLETRPAGGRDQAVNRFKPEKTPLEVRIKYSELIVIRFSGSSVHRMNFRDQGKRELSDTIAEEN